jgi:hypothetical protein
MQGRTQKAFQTMTDTQPSIIQEALQLSKEFHEAKTTAEDFMKGAVLIAHELGGALEAVRTNHADAFDLIIAQAELSKPMAARLIHLAKTTTRAQIESGEFRQGALQLQILPPAEKKAPAEDRRLDALPHFSAIALHWKRVARLMDLGQLRVDREKVKEKTADLYAWLRSVHESA